MGRGVAGDALEVLREVDDPLDARIGVDLLAQGRADLERLLEPDPELVRDGLRDPVDLAVAVTQDAPDVADGGPSEHRAERDDLGDVVLAVLAPDVRDHLVAPPVLEVDVDVGHRHPVRVEEPLERELVEDRVDRGDPERVGHDAAGRRATTRRLDALLAGEADEVRDDEEVAGVPHRGDDAELVIEPRLELRRDGAVPASEAGLALRAQPRLDGLAVGHREVRDAQLSERQGQVGHLGDPPGRQDRIVLVGKEVGHLGGRLDVELVGLELEPARRVEVVAGADAEQHVVRVGLLGSDVVQVVGDDQWQPRVAGQLQQLAVQPGLLGQPVVLELEVEAVRAEDVAVLAGDLAGELAVVDLQRLGDLAAQTGRQPDQPLGVAGEMLTVDARLVVVAVDVRVGDQAAQVAVPGRVLGQEDQVEGLAVGLALLRRHRARGDVRLDADDRLDALGRGGLVEGHRAVQRAVVGEGHRVHARGGGRVDQLGDPAEAVQQAEFGVDVEVGEVVRREGHGGQVYRARVGPVGLRPGPCRRTRAGTRRASSGSMSRPPRPGRTSPGRRPRGSPRRSMRPEAACSRCR